MTTDLASAGRRRYHSPARQTAAAATAQRIVEAAIEQFSTLPYEEVGLEDVARAAGVTVRTVIRRFGSKDDLFAAASSAAGARMVAQRDEAPVGDVRAAVRNVVAHYEEWGDQRLKLIAQEHRIAAIRRHTEEGRAFHRAWVERTFAPLIHGSTPAVRERRVLAVLAATDVYVWKLLRRDLGVSVADAERVIETLIAAAREGEK
jgi:AcrR family transcriptional regulator